MLDSKHLSAGKVSESLESKKLMAPLHKSIEDDDLLDFERYGKYKEPASPTKSPRKDNLKMYKFISNFASPYRRRSTKKKPLLNPSAISSGAAGEFKLSLTKTQTAKEEDES